MQKDKKNLANLLIKADKLSKSKEIALAEEFINITDKLEETMSLIKDVKETQEIDISTEKEPEIIYKERLHVVTLRGDKGDDYILTKKDKKEIAEMVQVPTVEKIVEKVEVIRETPIVTNEIKEVAKYENPETLRDKLESLKEENRLDASAIKNLPEFIQSDNRIGFGSMIKEAPKDNKYYARKNRQWEEVVAGAGAWGTITGTLSAQTDLQNALNLKYDASNPAGYITSSALSGYTPTSRTITINGTTQDLSSNRSWTIAVPTKTSDLTNDSGFITSSALTGYIQNNVGISGGTTLIGGTASGNNLTLVSTSNATKGKIIFGTSAYDEVNNRLGVGTTSPVASLDVSSPSGGAGTGIRLIQAANNVIQPSSYISIDFTVPTTGLIGQFFATASNYSNPSVNLAANSTGLISWDTNAQLLLGAAGLNGYISFDTGGYGYSNERMRIIANGNVGIGQTSPTAVLHIKAGTATAGTAPLKLTAGTNLTTAEAGAMEYNNTPHFTNSDATRRHMVLSPSATKVTAGAPYTNDGYITINIGGTDFKVMTTA